MQPKPIHYQTQLDSLHNTQHYLQMKVDSLSKIVNETRIATGFFSDVISQDLYMFTTIVFFAGLITWGSIYTALAIHKRQMRKEMSKSILEIKKEFNERIDELSEILTNTNYDVNRAMFFSVNRENDHPNSIGWILSSLQAFVFKTPHIDNKFMPDEFSTINLWLDQADRVIKNLVTGDPIVKGNKINLNFFIRYLNDNISDPDILKRLETIEADLNHIIYSKPEPPENIMEGEPEAGPNTEDIDHEEVPPT